MVPDAIFDVSRQRDVIRKFKIRDGGRHLPLLVLLTCLLSLLPMRTVQSESTRLAFNRAPIDLKTSSYGGILHDKDGFLWFATVGKGVFRYDGFELRSINKGTNGLSGSLINAIVEDSKGVIWIGSLSEGLTRYDKTTGKFTHFRNDPENANSLSSDNLPFSPRALLADRADRIWVGTQGGGLSMYDQATSTWTRYRHDPKNSNSLNSDVVLALAEDRDGKIWVGTKGGGLDKFDQTKGRWTHFRHNPDVADSLSDNWINAILEDQSGDIWVGTKNHGLDRLDPATGSFRHFRNAPNNPESLPSDEVWNLYEDRSGNIWTSHPGSPQGGLSMFDRNRDVFVRYPKASTNVKGLSSNGVVGLLQERGTGIFWAVNSDGTIDKHDPLASTFTVSQNDPNDPKSMSGSSILPIAEDASGRIWVGTFNSGLNAYDRDSRSFRRFSPIPFDDSSIPHARLSSLRIDRSGTLWIGSWGGTLTAFDPDRGVSVRHYVHDTHKPESITASERVKYIAEDRQDRDVLWIGTIGGGLERFNKRTGEFKHFKHDPSDPSSLSHNSIVTILDDGNGTLWVTTYGGGLEKLDKNTGLFSHFRHAPNEQDSINSNTLYEVYRDTSGTLWVSGKGGLSRFDEKTQRFENFNRANGFPSDIVDSILEDNRGNLWLATLDEGLIRFDPRTGTHRLFATADGLPSETFFWTSRLKSKDGTMWFGGSKGLVQFHPDEVVRNPYIPPVRLTAIRQGGREIDLGSAAERVRRVDLDWRNNHFEFQFAALSYSQPEKNTFAYKLEGRDKDWFFSGSSPFGRYSGLSGGEYTLRLKAANSSGLWNEQGTTVKIVVRPPFWESIWFYLALSMVIAAAIVTVAYYVTKLRAEIVRREKSELALAGTRGQLNDAIESFTDGFVLLDATDRFVLCNTHYRQAHPILDGLLEPGVQFETLVRKLAEGDFYRNVSNTVEQVVRSRMAKHRERRTFEYQEPGGDWFRMTEYTTQDGGTALVRMNINASKLSENRLLEAKEDAENANTSKSQFLATMSHEFRTPLNAILGFSEMLRSQYFGPLGAESYKEYADDIHDSGKHMLALINDILDLSAIEAGKRSMDKEHIAVNELLDNCIRNVEQAAEAGGIKLSSALPDNLPPLFADRRSVAQIVLNLLTNAVKFTDQYGSISVSAKIVGEKLSITVGDTGIGIPKDKLPYVTETFSRTHSDPHIAQKGTGLGLSIVKSLVEAHDGDLHIESEVGNGTIVTVNFPLQVVMAD